MRFRPFAWIWPSVPLTRSAGDSQSCAPAWSAGPCLRPQALHSPCDRVCLLPSSSLPAPNTLNFPATNTGPQPCQLLAWEPGWGGHSFLATVHSSP